MYRNDFPLGYMPDGKHGEYCCGATCAGCRTLPICQRCKKRVFHEWQAGWSYRKPGAVCECEQPQLRDFDKAKRQFANRKQQLEFIMNKIKNEPEETYSRLNGGGIGPVGIFMVFLVFLGLCPVLAWECVKWFVLTLTQGRKATKPQRISTTD